LSPDTLKAISIEEKALNSGAGEAAEHSAAAEAVMKASEHVGEIEGVLAAMDLE
jgi:hypothetical protein